MIATRNIDDSRNLPDSPCFRPEGVHICWSHVTYPFPDILISIPVSIWQLACGVQFSCQPPCAHVCRQLWTLAVSIFYAQAQALVVYLSQAVSHCCTSSGSFIAALCPAVTSTVSSESLRQLPFRPIAFFCMCKTTEVDRQNDGHTADKQMNR